MGIHGTCRHARWKVPQVSPREYEPCAVGPVLQKEAFCDIVSCVQTVKRLVHTVEMVILLYVY